MYVFQMENLFLVNRVFAELSHSVAYFLLPLF